MLLNFWVFAYTKTTNINTTKHWKLYTEQGDGTITYYKHSYDIKRMCVSKIFHPHRYHEYKPKKLEQLNFGINLVKFILFRLLTH